MLRGRYGEAEYGSVTIPFTALFRLECVMEPRRDALAELVSAYEGERQWPTHLKLRTRSEDSAGLSFWTTSDYTLRASLQDPDNVAANLIDYASGFSAKLEVFKSFDFENVTTDVLARICGALDFQLHEVTGMLPHEQVGP